EWQRFANLRLLYGWMYTHPGTKLLFMGSEIGQTSEWVADDSLHWDLLQHAPHQGVSRWVKALNTIYAQSPSLYERGFESEGMLWIDHHDHENSVLAFVRRGLNEKDDLLVVINLTPRPHDKYRIGIHISGEWSLALNSDDSKYFGSNYSILVSTKSKPIPSHGHPQSLELNLPPLGIIIYRLNP
ncbi:MAG TPA: alpha amylase C-terminal domain-containing protein, partial [Bacteroidia bacterium]|nr:alpha amylase C-terminal domain-containing protein [Bacteroidia bacterium]